MNTTGAGVGAGVGGSGVDVCDVSDAGAGVDTSIGDGCSLGLSSRVDRIIEL